MPEPATRSFTYLLPLRESATLMDVVFFNGTESVEVRGTGPQSPLLPSRNLRLGAPAHTSAIVGTGPATTLT